MNNKLILLREIINNYECIWFECVKNDVISMTKYNIEKNIFNKQIDKNGINMIIDELLLKLSEWEEPFCCECRNSSNNCIFYSFVENYIKNIKTDLNKVKDGEDVGEQ